MFATARISQLLHQLGHQDGKGEGTVMIGNVKVKVEGGEKRRELIPSIQMRGLQDNKDLLGHLRWMMQKGNLNQDMFLIGPPGPLRRMLCMLYAQIRQIEIEYVALSRDVTESDLKQRREIANGTSFYSDQACVRAAIHGRLLILDGVEKAERNILPILNNLLENREMALEDGRFLMHHSKYDKLVNSGLFPSAEKFVRTSEKFLCIALGLPTPKYDGFTLDPPFRSRFQARYVGSPSLETQIRHLASRGHSLPGLEQVLQVQQVLQGFNSDQGSPIPDFPIFLERFKDVLAKIPGLHARNCLELVYPFLELSNADSQMVSVVNSVLDRFNLMKHGEQSVTFVQSGSSAKREGGHQLIQLQLLQENGPAKEVSLNVPAGPFPSASLPFFVETPYHNRCLALLMLAHSVGDVCLVGEKGSGKSALTRLFASLLGYEIEFVPLYKDLSSRDLLQRRSTNSTGDTIWENSGLVKAALKGSIAILDPIDVLPLGTLSSIQRLVIDRDLCLPDGRCLVNHVRFQELVNSGLSVSDLAKRGILRIHPSFRIIAIARPDKPSLKRGRWLNGEILSMFSFVPMRLMKIDEEEEVLKTLFPSIDVEKLQKVTQFAQALRAEKDDTMKELASNFSTRQLIRLTRRLALYPKDSLYSAIMKVSLFRFLPNLAREALSCFLAQQDIKSEAEDDNGPFRIEQYQTTTGKKMVKIGNVEAEVLDNSPKILVPQILFYENERQTQILQDILKDFLLGENLLLIGNQGGRILC